MYACLQPVFPSESRIFWDGHIDWIKKGVIHIGKFEKYFHLFRKGVLPFIHNRQRINELFSLKDSAARLSFYKDQWNTWRWQLLFRLFFSRRVMGWFGRDPEFFKYVHGDVAGPIIEHVQCALTHLAAEQNPYLDYILNGNFTLALPFYLRRENFDSIRQNLDKLQTYKGNLTRALRANRDKKFDGFNLSDIFEYMREEQYVEQLKEIVTAGLKGSRLVYWNMLADRKSPLALHDRITPLNDLAKKLFVEDKAFFYKAIVIEEVL